MHMRVAAGACQRTLIACKANKFTPRSHMQWAGDWQEALEPKSKQQQQQRHAEVQDAAAPTPHPAAASAAEGAEWEAVLLSREQPAEAYAVVECGSHSTRLLIRSGAGKEVTFTRDTHLGQQQQQQQHNSHGGAGTGRLALDDGAAAAVLAVLREFAAVLADVRLAPGGLAVVATEAVRAADNADSLLAAAADILGCPVRVLSGVEEGRLAFRGATASLQQQQLQQALNSSSDSCRRSSSSKGGRPCLLLDLGGRSTELAVGYAGRVPQHVSSVPLGCLSVMAGAGQPGQQGQQPAQLLQQSAAAILMANAETLQSVLRALNSIQSREPLVPSPLQQQQQQQQQQQDKASRAAAGSGLLVAATGGTVTTVAALLQQLPWYEHDAVHLSRVCKQDVQQLLQQLMDEAYLQSCLGQFPWLTEARARSLAPGCAGLAAIMEALNVSELLVSDCDLLHGVLLELQGR